MSDTQSEPSNGTVLVAVEAHEEIDRLIIEPQPDWARIAELADRIRQVADKLAGEY